MSKKWKGWKKRRKKIRKFFQSVEWKRLRYEVLKRDKGTCLLCGRSARDGYVMNVDHIKPRHKYPHLALDIGNLQTLCSTCNWGKGGKDETDWRGMPDLDAEYRAIMAE